jgi:hypothetical protein
MKLQKEKTTNKKETIHTFVDFCERALADEYAQSQILLRVYSLVVERQRHVRHELRQQYVFMTHFTREFGVAFEEEFEEV